MAYEEQCGTCVEFKDKRDGKTPFDINYANSEKGYCDYHQCYYWAEDSCFRYKDRDTYVPGACYITTIVCEKLNYSDNCGILNTLRGFRDNVMQKDSKYCKILLEYDVIGPKIAGMIREDKSTDKEMWIAIYNFYLSQTANFILDKKYDDAVSRYTEMVNALKGYYGISEDVIEVTKNYDMSQGGHGRVKLLERKGEI